MHLLKVPNFINIGQKVLISWRVRQSNGVTGGCDVWFTDQFQGLKAMSSLRPLHQSIAWSRVFPIASTIVSMKDKRFTQRPIGNEPKDVPPGPTGIWSNRMAYRYPLISAVKILFIVRILILIRPTDQIIPRKKWLCAMLLPQASIPRHTDLLIGPRNCPMVFTAGTQNQETCVANWYLPPIGPSEKSQY